MESIGEKLKFTREEKSLSIERVARDTNIAGRYLEALESENFALFPGEPYLMGFLRNYSEYLGLDPQNVINLYKNYKIQEQPVPIDELLHKKNYKPLIIGILVFLGAAIIGLAVYFLVPVFSNLIAEAREKKELQADPDDLLEFSGPSMLEQFTEKEGVRFLFGESEDMLIVDTINPNGAVVLRLPDKSVELGINQEETFMTGANSDKEFSVLVSEVNTKDKLVSLFINRIDEMNLAAGINTEAVQAGDGSITPINPSPQLPPENADEISGAAAAERIRPTIAIKTSDVPQPYQVEIIFDQECLFRYKIGYNGDIVEAYYTSGKRIRLEPSGNTPLTFWASNAGAFNLKVASAAVQVGQNGEVVVRKTAWREIDAKEWVLELVPVY